MGALAGAGAAFFQGGDTQAVVAGAFGGAIAGGIAGTGTFIGLGVPGIMGAQAYGAALGGVVGDLLNLRQGTPSITAGDVAERALIRTAFGVAGGQFGLAVGRLAAPGLIGVASRALDDVLIGGACSIEADYATGN